MITFDPLQPVPKPTSETTETVQEIADFFDKHGDTWRLAYNNEIEHWNQYFPLRRREAWALTQIRDEPKETAVDLGCGTGHALIKMRQLGFQQLMGVDISSEMLSAAASLVEENQLQDVQLVNADVQNIALLADDSVDVCTALGVIEYLDEDGPLLAEIERILKPGGVAIIQTRNYPCLFVRTRKLGRRLLSRRETKIAHREHSPGNFKAAARRHGLRVERQRFIHYYALFPLTIVAPLRRLLQPLDHWLSKQCERAGALGVSRFFASMHVLKLRKPV